MSLFHSKKFANCLTTSTHSFISPNWISSTPVSYRFVTQRTWRPSFIATISNLNVCVPTEDTFFDDYCLLWVSSLAYGYVVPYATRTDAPRYEEFLPSSKEKFHTIGVTMNHFVLKWQRITMRKKTLWTKDGTISRIPIGIRSLQFYYLHLLPLGLFHYLQICIGTSSMKVVVYMERFVFPSLCLCTCLFSRMHIITTK